MPSKRNTQLSLQDKRKIIETIEAREKVGAKPNFTQIARDFNTHRTTIGKIAKDRDIFKVYSHFYFYFYLISVVC